MRDDPELFRVYHDITESARGVVGTHVATLSKQLERMMADGVASGEFSPDLDTAAARAFLQATATFHHPALVAQEPVATGADAQAVFELLLAGLRAGFPRAPGCVSAQT